MGTKINLKQLRADLNSKGAKTHYVELSYSFKRTSDATELKWQQLVSKVLKGADIESSGRGKGYAEVHFFTRDPDGACALAKKIAKQLKMQVKCSVAPAEEF